MTLKMMPFEIITYDFPTDVFEIFDVEQYRDL